MVITKICTKCKEEKPTTTEFFFQRWDRKDKLGSWCKICVGKYGNSEQAKKNRAKYEQSSKYKKTRRIYRRTPGYKRLMRRGYLKYLYKMTEDDYVGLFAGQKGCCAICGRHQSEFKKRLAVDHNHTTGEVRSLLCVRCNSLLGYSGENIKILEKTIKYIRSHNE